MHTLIAVAVFRHLDRLARDRLGFALEQVLHEHGPLVARSARAAGRIAALAFLKLHLRFSFPCHRQKPIHPGASAPACS